MIRRPSWLLGCHFSLSGVLHVQYVVFNAQTSSQNKLLFEAL